MYRPRKLLSILVVEDDLSILKEIGMLILSHFSGDVQVLKAKTYEEGKAAVLQGLFDIAVIDLFLPDGHGEDLIKLIREDDLDLPIIVQTAEEDKAYQAKIHNKYGGLTYLEKPLQFDELKERLTAASNKYRRVSIERISVTSHKRIDVLDINEVCYISKIPESNNLHLELYDYEAGDYKFYIINGMTLADFIKTYNDSGYFLRCHNSYIVNRRMIASFSRTDNLITMLWPRKNGGNIILDVSEKYRKEVRDALKGLF